MAILRPHITKVGNRHYRKLAFDGSQFNETSDNIGKFGNENVYFYLRRSLFKILRAIKG